MWNWGNEAAAAAAKSLQLCLTLSTPMDCSLPGSSIHGIFQARVLEWGAIAFSGNEATASQLVDIMLHLVAKESGIIIPNHIQVRAWLCFS